MAFGKRSWRAMKRQYARDFPHHVRLVNAGGWRTRHKSDALRHLDNRAYRWWTDRRGWQG